MLVEQWTLGSEPLSDTKLRPAPPKGLGKNNQQIRGLEGPIETQSEYFRDFEADVVGNHLEEAETVGELRDKIWDGIPVRHKA